MRKQTGLRLDPQVWTGYKRLCLEKNVRPNELVELAMRRAVDSGSVKILDHVGGQSSAAEAAADIVTLQGICAKIDSLLHEGHALIERSFREGTELPSLSSQFDGLTEELSKIARRIRDPGLHEMALGMMDRVCQYSELETELHAGFSIGSSSTFGHEKRRKTGGRIEG